MKISMSAKKAQLRPLTDAEMNAVSGGMTNAQTQAGAAFISGFLKGGGTMGSPGGPRTPAGSGDCHTSCHSGGSFSPT